MKAIVAYDSVFGNTGQVAQAMGDALRSRGEVETLQVSDVQPDQLAGVDLLIVGSPTRQFKATPATIGFLKGIPKKGLEGIKVAAFDARFTVDESEKVRILAWLVRIFGYAAQPIAGRLEKKGGKLVAPPEGFFVTDVEGPLLEGESERAVDWARQLAAKLS